MYEYLQQSWEKGVYMPKNFYFLVEFSGL